MTPQKSEFAQMRDDYVDYLRDFAKRKGSWSCPLDYKTFESEWYDDQQREEHRSNRAQMAHVRSMTDMGRYV